MILLKLLRFWLPVVLYAGLIFWASSLEGVHAPASIPHVDKVIHLIEYSLLGWLVARALSYGNASWSVLTIQLFVVLITTAYGISDEIHQSFVPGRSADFWDIMADMAGGALGGWIYHRTK